MNLVHRLPGDMCRFPIMIGWCGDDGFLQMWLQWSGNWCRMDVDEAPLILNIIDIITIFLIYIICIISYHIIDIITISSLYFIIYIYILIYTYLYTANKSDKYAVYDMTRPCSHRNMALDAFLIGPLVQMNMSRERFHCEFNGFWHILIRIYIWS